MTARIRHLFLVVFVLSICQMANCGFIKDIYNSAHNTAEKVHDDIHNIFDKKSDSPNEDGKITGFNNSDKSTGGLNELDKQNQDSVTTPLPSSTTVVSEQENKVSKSSVVAAKDPISISKDETKDGRNNFKAGCSPGYKRTSDNRCEKSFSLGE